jgi:hypothetical protein
MLGVIEWQRRRRRMRSVDMCVERRRGILNADECRNSAGNADDVVLWWMEESDEGGEKRSGSDGLRVAIRRGRCCCCVVVLLAKEVAVLK